MAAGMVHEFGGSGGVTDEQRYARSLPGTNRDDLAYAIGLDPLNARINDQRYQQYQTRLGQQNTLNQAYSDPSRQSYYDMLYNGALDSGLQNAQDVGNTAYKQNYFSQANRGLLGGSNDIAHRASVGRSLDLASLGAANEANTFSQNYKNSDTDKRVNLERLIQSTDPAQQAGIQQQLRGISDVTQAGLGQQQLVALQQRQKQEAQNAKSQLLGNAIGYFGNAYQTDQMGRAYGGQGLSWMPQFGYSPTATKRSA